MFTMRFCPYAHRVQLVLDALDVPYHAVNINLKQKPLWLTDYSRSGKVPALGLTDVPGTPYITQSLIIADYLDEKYAVAAKKQSLWPSDPVAKAQDRLWLDRFSSGMITAFFRFVLGTTDARPDLDAGLAEIEAELVRRGTKLFSGSAYPGMLDYMIWPWLERLPALRLLSGDAKYEIPAALQPLFDQYFVDMSICLTCRKSSLTAEQHHRFISGERSGQTDYDFLHKE